MRFGIPAALRFLAAAALTTPFQPATLSVEGYVKREDGKPLAGVKVALEHPYRPGIITPTATTDERGAFRVDVAKPGRYRICADPGPNLTILRTPGRIEGEQPIRTCYSRDSAAPSGDLIELSATPRTGIEIRVRRSLLYSISGRLIDADGFALDTAWFNVRRADGVPLTSIDVKRTGNQFVIRGAPPGDYLLTSRRLAPDGSTAELGLASVFVGAADVEGVELRTVAPVSIVGRVEFAEGLPTIRPKINVNTVGERQRRPGALEGVSHVRDDLTFRLDGLFGAQMLQVFGAMKPWAVKEIRYRGQDIYGRPIEFRGGTTANDLVVVLTNQPAFITATLRASAAPPPDTPTVVLIPLDPITGAVLENAVFRPLGAEPPFGLPLVRPGTYLIAAIAADDAAGDRSMLVPRLIPVARRITLAPGEHRQIELDLVVPQ